MSDTPNPFISLLKMGSEMAQAFGPGAEPFSPEQLEKLWPTMPKEMMELFLGKGLNPEALDAKTRLLLTLQGLTIQGALAEPQMRLTFRHLKEIGATDQEIRETVALAGLFGGAPAMTKALSLFDDVTRDLE
jgi:4-carboxymuconolactone decarboxylase